MRTLYHFALSPFSRKVRIVLKEKGLDFDLINEKYWDRRPEYLAMNPSAQVPLLVEEDESCYSDSTAICEYIEEQYDQPKLVGTSITDKAEARRLSGWFNNKFYYEVTKYILDEKVIKYFRKQGQPDTNCIRAGKNNMLYHLDYIAHLTSRRTWMAGDYFSLADITAAAHLSVLDYLGDVPWEHSNEVKEWYALVKSRPSFRPLLDDKVPSFKPPRWYKDPDF